MTGQMGAVTVPARLSGPLADSLRRNRDRFNAAYFLARRASPRIDEASFAGHLCDNLQPVVDAVARHAPERVDAVVQALYDVSLELLCKGGLSESGRSKAMRRFWHELLPAVHSHLAHRPDFTVRALLNAALNLVSTKGARVEEWIEGFPDLALQTESLDEALDAGRVFAWRCGMAQIRRAALTAAGRMRPAAALAALGIAGNVWKRTPRVPDILLALTNDPWLHPEEAAAGAARKNIGVRAVAVAGGFRGFGGPFASPPRAALIDGAIVLYDSECAWHLDADIFGTVFHKVVADISVLKDANILRDESQGITVSPEGAIVWNDAAGRLQEAENASSMACDGVTAAITRFHSHKVLLITRSREGAHSS